MKKPDKPDPLDPIESTILVELANLKNENAVLKNWILSGQTVPVCSVCGKPIDNVSIQRRNRPHLWHDKKCFQWKPKKIIALEHAYNLDIVDILKETTRKYGSIKSQCDALGVSIPYFYSIVKKYCSKNLLKFMADNATGKRKELYQTKIDNSSK